MAQDYSDPEISVAVAESIASWRRIIDACDPSNVRLILRNAAADLWQMLEVDRTVHPESHTIARQDVVDALQQMAEISGIEPDDAQAIFAASFKTQDHSGNGGNGKYSQGNAANDNSWDDPDWTLLDDRRGELPEFPVDVFPPAWQAWLLRASHGAGVRPDHVAVPLLGVASSLIGTARRVRASRSWSEPMTLWACVVAASGDRKTPGLNVTVRALDLIERNSSADTNAKRLTHETKVQKAKEVQKKWKDERQAALDANPPREPPPMPIDAIDPGNFIEPRLYATDPTIERLASLLVSRPRGMMLIRDELTGLFVNMGRYSGGSDRPFWLEAWNGGRHVVERVSGSIVVDHLLVGVVGSFQPDKLARAFAGDEDGMYGRFLYAWPLTPDYRPLTNDAAEVEPELQSALTALIRLPSESEDGAFVPQRIWLSDDAIATFEEFSPGGRQNKARPRRPRKAVVRQRRDYGAAARWHSGLSDLGDLAWIIHIKRRRCDYRVLGAAEHQ